MPGILQGMGMGMVFAPLGQLAFVTLSREHNVGGAVVYNLFRTLGGSFGVSIVNTYLSTQKQLQWHRLGSGLTPFNEPVRALASTMQTSLYSPHFMATLNAMLQKQSTRIAFVHSFGFITMSFIILIPCALLFKKPKVIR